ncbi:MAG TPA: L,D-transpeptidase family protein [Gammaproteobacteria bacterium]
MTRPPLERMTRVVLLAAWLVAAPVLAEGDEAESGDLHQALVGQLAEQPADEILLHRERVRRFYALHDNLPAWSGRAADVAALLEVLREAHREGLQPERYHLDAITALLESLPSDAPTEARLDQLLTDAFIAYSLDVRRGRLDPRAVDRSWHIPPSDYEVERMLLYALESNTVQATLNSMPPYQRGYRRLRSALASYRVVAADGGWPTLAAGPVLKPGMTGKRVALLRQRLLLSGDLPASAGAGELFDPLLEVAVRRFQARHGLREDGAVGEEMRQALNVPVEQRIAQLVASMERWRWMPRHLESRYLLVNMTGYRLDVLEEDLSVLQMRVIIGSDYRQTPAFGSRVTAMTFNPSWYVPNSVFRKDMLPRLKQDSGYLAERNIAVLDDLAGGGRVIDPSTIDWSLYDEQSFPYALHQPPGARNPLGRVKFVIPNSYRIYLHDTPQRNLFARRERTFSSGCIRLEKPLDLAAYLLAQEPEAKEAQVERYLANATTRTVALKQPLPIYLVYWTAWADEDGVVQFRDDIYSRDVRLVAALLPEQTRSARVD